MVVGICGVIHFDSQPVDLAGFKKMVDRFNGMPAMRIGPWYAVAQAGYNFIKSERECPTSEDGVIVCFEGRIDNRDSLTQRLGLEQDCSYSRLVQRAYSKWGTNLAKHLLGAFAFIVIHEGLRVAIIATDHVNLRPLFYYRDKSKFVFGSDIRQVIDGIQLPPVINRGKILEFLSPIVVIDEGVASPETSFFDGIKTLPHATCLVVSDNGRTHFVKYWEPSRSLSRKWQSPDDFAIEFRKTFYNVIAEYIRDELPIGADLSGGIDSGSVVFVVQDILQQKGLCNDFHTYTLSYDFELSQQDVAKIRLALRNHPNIQWRLIQADKLCGPLEFGQFHKYRSIACPCTMNIPESYVQITRMAQTDGCGFLLTGQGADYYLEGTDVIWDSAIQSRNWKLLWNSIRVLRSRSSIPLLARYLFRYAIVPLLPFGVSTKAYLKEYYKYTFDCFYPDLFTFGFSHDLSLLLKQQSKILAQRDSLECWAQRLEHELLFPPVHSWQAIPVDIEVRHPYFDRRLLEFGLTVPPEFKFEYSSDKRTHYGSRKVLQRKGLKDIVPSEIIDSQVKALYASPMLRRLNLYLPKIFASSQSCLVDESRIVDMNKLGYWIDKVSFADKIGNLYPVSSWLDSILNLELWLRATLDEFPSAKLPTWS